MRIAFGSTRFVFLVKGKAIKIGKVRLFRFFVRMLILPFSAKRRLHFFTKYGISFKQAILNDLFAGLYANRGEYEYYRASKDDRVMPILKSRLGGWVVIQMHGEPVSEKEITGWLRIRGKRAKFDRELAATKQFCRHPISGHVVLVDYGSPVTRDFLLRTI